MKTEKLIQQLVAEAAPVKPLPSPLRQFLKWTAIAFLYLAAITYFIGTRPDVIASLSRPALLLQVILIFFLVLFGALSVFFLAIPDRQDRWFHQVPIALLIGWSASVVGMIFFSDAIHAGAGLKCLRNIALVSIPPGMVLFYMLKRSVTLQIQIFGFLAAVTSSALGCLATRFICPNENPFHFFVWHFLPVILLGFTGAGVAHVLGRREP